MAILLIDSFDHYDDSTEMQRKGWTISSWSFTFAQGGRFSGYSIAPSANDLTPGRETVAIHPLPNTSDFLYFGVAVYLDSTIYPKFVGFMDSGSYQCGIKINTDRTLSIMRGSYGGTVLYTTTTFISLTTWTHISFEVLIHNSVGTAKLWINGELICDLSGLDTQATSNAYANQVVLYGQNRAQSIKEIYFDDLYVGDDSGSVNTSCPTEARIVSLYPTSSGTYAEWSHTGTTYAWQAVDDSFPDDNTSYIYSNVSGTRATFTFGDLDVDVDNVYAIQLVDYGRKDDADVRATKFMMGLPSGTFYNLGTGSYMGSDYQYFTYIQEVDPSTDSALDRDVVNNNEYGIVVST